MKMELNKNDPEAQALLWTGRLKTKTGEKKAYLRAVSPDDPAKLYFDLKDHQEVTMPALSKRVLIATRAFSLTATLTPALVTWMLGHWGEGYQTHTSFLVLSLLSLLFLQIAVNVLNDVEDHVNLVDLPGDIGGSGVIQKGWLSAKSMAMMGYGSLLLAFALGLAPLIEYWKVLLPIGLIALIGTLGYSGMGFRFKYRAMGDLVVFFLCGPLLVAGVSVATFGTFTLSILIAGIVFGLAAVGILHANNLNDLDVDQSRGARTVANQIGFKASKRYLAWIYLSSALILAVSGARGWVPIWFALAPFIAALPVVKMLKKVKQAVSPLSPVISSIRFEAAQIHLMIGGSWIFGFLILRSVEFFRSS